MAYSGWIFYLYVGQGHIAEQEAESQLTNFNPSGYNSSHDSQGTPRTETNIIEQSESTIEHNSKLGGWINGFGPEYNHLQINMSRLVQSQMDQLDPDNAHYNLGSPPYSRHDPEPRSTTSAARPKAGTTPRPRPKLQPFSRYPTHDSLGTEQGGST